MYIIIVAATYFIGATSSPLQQKNTALPCSLQLLQFATTLLLAIDPLMSFKTDWLDVNHLAQAWSHLDDGQDKIDTAAKCLQLMDEYKALHPEADNMIHYLNSKRVPHVYDDVFCDTVLEQADKHMVDLEDTLNTLFLKGDHSSLPVDNQDLWNSIRRAVIVCTVEGKFQRALDFLADYKRLVMFYSQVTNEDMLVANAYIEYLFYRYILNCYSLIFVVDGNMVSGNKTLQPIVKKIDYYYTKNELVLFQNVLLTEMKFYRLVKFYGLVILFKQFKLKEFVAEVMEFLKTPDFVWLIQCFPNMLCLLEISLVFLKPFNQLSLLEMDDEILIDELNHHHMSKYLYDYVLFPLSQGNYSQVQQLFDDSSFANKFDAYLAVFLPFSIKKKSFLEYLRSMINYKIFVLIISRTRAIPRSKLIGFLGYSFPEREEALHNDLLALIGALDLGKYNIGYDYANDFYFNYEQEQTMATRRLQDSVDNLTVESQAEALANILKGLLIEKFMN